MKKTLKYIGNHLPQEEVLVEESLVDGLLKTGVYELAGEQHKPEMEQDKKPSKKWKEKDIKEYIEANKIPVKYDLINDTKEDILLRLKEKGYL